MLWSSLHPYFSQLIPHRCSWITPLAYYYCMVELKPCIMEDLSFLNGVQPTKYDFVERANDVGNERVPKRFSFSSEERSEDAIQVYLRVKPDGEMSKDGFLSFDEEDQNSLLLKKKSTLSKFSFTYIFKPNTTQEEVFLKSTEVIIQEFLNGRNAFLFTYGTSSSGKTFTIQGRKGNPGLIPRIIASIFSSLENSIDDSYCYCPERSVSIIKLTESEVLEKFIIKEKVLNWAKNLVLQHVAKSDDIISLSELEMLKNKTKKLNVDKKDVGVFSVWVSFAEIYNERIYDLLDDLSDVKTSLSLSTDSDKRAFIKGLRHIHVTTLEEAYFLYYYGCYNRSMGYTAVNERSSRSHSVFTLKILGREKEISDGFFVSSSFSVCDLAGTERSSKTRIYGSRMKESQSINSSFLVLNRCLKIIRENQLRDTKQVVPYRESKLTQIMGPSFTVGDTNLLMIVTVAQSKNLMNETESSLRSSAVATEIKAIIHLPTQNKKKMRFSSTFSHLNPGCGIDWKELISCNDKFGTSAQRLQSDSLQLVKALELERNKRTAAETRLAKIEKIYEEKIENLIDEQRKFIEQLQLNKESEETKAYQHQQECEQLAKQKEELYNKFMNSKADILKLQKKHRLLKDDYDELTAKVKSLESTNDDLEDLLDDAKEEVEGLQEEVKALTEAMLKKDESLAQKDEKISLLEWEISQLEENLEHNASEREVYDRLLITLETDLKEKKTEISKLMGKCNKYEEDIKLLKNSQTVENVRKKNILIKIEDYSSADVGDNQRTPEMQRSKSEECLNVLTDSDDPSFILPIDKAKTTAKKKKRKQAKDLETSYYFDGGQASSSSTSTSRSTRRQLYKKTSEEELGELSDGFSGDNKQDSPNTIFRTLRTGKKY